VAKYFQPHRSIGGGSLAHLCIVAKFAFLFSFSLFFTLFTLQFFSFLFPIRTTIRVTLLSLQLLLMLMLLLLLLLLRSQARLERFAGRPQWSHLDKGEGGNGGRLFVEAAGRLAAGG